jgi:hypothetical protein
MNWRELEFTLPKEDGWSRNNATIEPGGLYGVLVSYGPTNPLHRATLLVGLVNHFGLPSNGSYFCNKGYDVGALPYYRAYKVIVIGKYVLEETP